MFDKLAGDSSDFVRLMLRAGFEEVYGGKHYKYHPPKYINEYGEKRSPVYLNVKGADPETIGKPIFITLSASMEGENRNEVQSWKRAFKALDYYPYMRDIFGGSLPSEIFNEWDGTPKKKQEKAEVESRPVQEKIPTILDNEYRVLPVWCTNAKPYFEEFLKLKPEFISAQDALDKAKQDLEKARIKGYSTRLNEAKVDSLTKSFETIKSNFEKTSQNLTNIVLGDKNFKTAEDVVLFMQKRLERGFDYSILSLDNVNQFIVILPMTDYSLKYSSESAYKDICDILGVKELNEKIKENIDATVKYLVNSGKIELDNDKNIKYSDERLNTLLKKLGKALKDLNKVAAKKKKRTPTNKPLWSRAIAEAKRKYDVYPSAYANGYALKWYKEHGGGWRGKKKI